MLIIAKSDAISPSALPWAVIEKRGQLLSDFLSFCYFHLLGFFASIYLFNHILIRKLYVHLGDLT